MSEQIAVVPVGMENSKGHDVYARMWGLLLDEQGVEYSFISLKPEFYQTLNPLEFLCQRTWEMAERSKVIQANGQIRQGLIAITGDMIAGEISRRVRESRALNIALTYDYSRRLAKTEKVISTHYLAFEPAGLGGYFVGPDISPQPAVAKIMRRNSQTVLSPQPNYSEDLIELGVDSKRIEQTGVIVPRFLYEVIPARLASQELVNSGQIQHKGFISLGGSAPESGELLKLIPQIIDQGIELTVICGDNRQVQLDFRTALEQIRNRLKRPELLKLLGGTADFTRQDEIDAVISCYKDPEITLAITRPNENLTICSALGMQVALLKAYQRHEIKSAGYALSKACESVVPVSSLLKKQMPPYPHTLHAQDKNWIKAVNMAVTG